MALFSFKALTEDGRIVKNKVEETNRSLLINTLKENGLYPIEVIQIKSRRNNVNYIQRKNTPNVNELIKKISTNVAKEENIRKITFKEKINKYLGTTEKITERDLAIFTQNFYLLKKANFNNIHALTTIINSTENISLIEVLRDILAGVESGEYMYKTMEYYGDVFPYIYINMIKVGELSGSLENALLQAVEYLDGNASINRRLKGILIPNIAQFILIMVMLFVGTLYALPQIQKVFDQVGTSSTLPKMTLMFQAFVNKLIQFWYIPAFCIVGIIIAIIWYINTPKGKYNFHYFKYTMPIFGSLIFSLDFSRFLKAMLLNLRNDMRIQDTLEVSRNIINNYVMLAIIENSLKNILIGQSWIEPFEKSGLPSPMMTEMLKIGMQTDLTEMMDKLVDYMKIDIDIKIEKIMKVLPQVMYSLVGIILIFFVLVVVVPMIQVYMGNFLFDAYL